MCGLNLKDKKNRDWGFIGTATGQLSIKSRLWWFGHAEHKDDADCLKQKCMKMEIGVNWQRGYRMQTRDEFWSVQYGCSG